MHTSSLLAGALLAVTLAAAPARALPYDASHLLVTVAAEYRDYRCTIQDGGSLYNIYNVRARSDIEAANIARSRIPIGHRVIGCGPQ